MAIEVVSPTGLSDGVPAGFAWTANVPPPFTVVLFDAGYRELGRVDGIADYELSVPPEWAALLAAGGTFHWHVAGHGEDWPTQSLTGQIEIR